MNNHKVSSIRFKSLIILLALICLVPKKSEAQDLNAGLAIGAGLLAIGTGIAAMHDLQESAELDATEWLLQNHPEINSFSVQTLNFDNKKIKDLSKVSAITYMIQEFIPNKDSDLDGKKYILFGFTSRGWINDYGIDVNKILYHFIDMDEWLNMMTVYSKAASGLKDDKMIRSKLKEGRIVNKGVKIKSKLVIPFYKLSGDMYVTADYNENMRFAYNERSLGIFLKKTRDLVQIRRNSIINIHNFFFHPDKLYAMEGGFIR